MSVSGSINQNVFKDFTVHCFLILFLHLISERILSSALDNHSDETTKENEDGTQIKNESDEDDDGGLFLGDFVAIDDEENHVDLSDESKMLDLMNDVTDEHDDDNEDGHDENEDEHDENEAEEILGVKLPVQFTQNENEDDEETNEYT